MSIFRAKVLTSSEADDLHRVKITAPGYFVESPLIEVLNNIPLNVDDIVLVSDAAGFESPLIIGRCFSTSSQFDVLGDSVNVSCNLTPEEFKLSNEKLQLTINNDELQVAGDSDCKVTINGGSNGGLINISKLHDKITAFSNKFGTHTHSITNMLAVTTISGTVTITATFVSCSSVTDKLNIQVSQFEDTFIKH